MTASFFPLALLLSQMSVAQAADTLFLIMVDGTNYETITRLEREGRLPAFRTLLEGGRGTITPTVSTFPSSTAPSVPEFLTGQYIDRLDPEAVQRVQAFHRGDTKIYRYEFDREAWDPKSPNLFDRVAEAGKMGWNYYPGRFEEASKNPYNGFLYRFDWLLAYGKLRAPRLDQRAFRWMRRDIRRAEAPPALVFATLDNADVQGHCYGLDSKEYVEAYQEQDEILGQLVETLKNKPHPEGGSWFDHARFLLFGDHGMSDSGIRVNLGAEIAASGVRALDSGDFAKVLAASLNRDWAQHLDALVLGTGSNTADIHLRKRGSAWGEHPSLDELLALPGPDGLDLVHHLAHQEGMDQLLAAESPGRVRIFAHSGAEALVAREGEPGAPRRFAYQVLRTDADGRDPFGYLQEPAALALVTPLGEPLRFWDEAVWFQATARTAYPYAPALIPKAFRPGDPTTADLIANAQEGYSFLPVVYGDHGALVRSSVTTFMLASAPGGCTPSDQPLLRLIDLHAEALRWMGLPIDPTLDSRPMGLCP